MSSLLDYYLYYDEDQDIPKECMTEFSPVEAAHVRELVEREFLKSGEVFSHKGWHHQLYTENGRWWGSMWGGFTGDERLYMPRYNKWED